MSLEQFIKDSNQAKSPDELVRLYLDTIKQLGFNRFVYSLVSGNPALKPHNHIGIVNNYPRDWISHYIASNYYKDDPIYKLAVKTQKPFSWNSIEPKTFTEKQKKIFREREEAGIKNGFSMLMYGPLGEITGISVANDGDSINQDANFTSLLYATMNQFVLRVTELMHDTQDIPPPITLSPREQEVLRWCAEGKSNGIIADILGVSKKTIEFHFSSIFKKLQVNSRILAVLKAVSLRLITL